MGDKYIIERDKIGSPYELLILGIIIVFSFFVSQWNFLLFHTGIELYSIIIGIMIYIFSMYSYKYIRNCYFPFLGIAYLFVSIIDLIHTLAYKGMSIFPNTTANEPTQLWIIARYTESISLAVAPIFFYKKIKSNCLFSVYLVYGAVLGILMAMIFYFKSFPACYVEGVGLTPFKKISEYIISGILVLSSFILWKSKENLDDTVFSLITLSILATIISELFFTLYISVYGISNVIGHIFKLISFYFIGKALLEMSLRSPYKTIFAELTKEVNTFKDYIEYAGTIFLLLDRNGKVSLINKMGSDVLGYPKDEIIGKDWFENFIPEYTRKEIKDYFFRLIEDSNVPKEEYLENYVRARNGEKVIRWHNSLLRDENGKVFGVLSSGVDFTREKELEERLTYYATIDELTGVYNKRMGLEIVRRELELATIKNS
ncbi:MAG: MASE3 domain-containing protein, partial [bacterium]